MIGIAFFVGDKNVETGHQGYSRKQGLSVLCQRVTATQDFEARLSSITSHIGDKLDAEIFRHLKVRHPALVDCHL